MRVVLAAVLVLAAAVAGVTRLVLTEVRPSRAPESGSITAVGGARAGDGPDVSTPAWPDRAATPEEVRSIVRRGRGAGAEEIPVLRAAALGASDPLVAGNAMRALGRLGAVSGDPALVDLVRDPRLRVRQETVLALGRSRDAAAVQRLRDILRDGSPDLRPLAIQALAMIGGDAARQALR